MRRKGRSFFIKTMAIVCSILTLLGLVLSLIYYI